MVHPVLQLLATQPQLLADHAQAYLKLVATEVDRVAAAWRRQTLLHAAALCCLGVAWVLLGVACMLWVALPSVPGHALWVLLGAPALPALAGAWCLRAARPPGEAVAFDNVRQQLREDLMLLREVSAR